MSEEKAQLREWQVILRELKSKVSQQEEMEEVNRTPKSDPTHYDTVRWGRRAERLACKN